MEGEVIFTISLSNLERSLTATDRLRPFEVYVNQIKTDPLITKIP
jgi:hypothetical protein